MNRLCLCLLASGLPLLLGGCSKDLQISTSPYAGPSIGVDSSGEWHEVVAGLPSPGWEITIDSRRPALGTDRVFLTLRRPNPVAVYPARTVIQHVLTTVRTEKSVEVYARLLAYTDKDDGAYRPVRSP